MKIVLQKILTVLFTLSVFVLTGAIIIASLSCSKLFYKVQFEKYDTLESVQEQSVYLEDSDAIAYVSNMTDDQLMSLMFHTMKYCLYLEDDLNIKVDGKVLKIFRDDEYSHMRDVKKVFGGAIILVIVSLLVFVTGLILGLKKKKSYYDNCRKVPFVTLCVTFALVVAIGIFVAIDFTTAFDLFHRIFFDGNWEFSDGVMIYMIGYIFFDLVPLIIVGWILLLLAFTLGMHFYNKALKKKFAKQEQV